MSRQPNISNRQRWMRPGTMVAVLVLAVAATITALVLRAGGSNTTSAVAAPCSRGKIALTFDDGPGPQTQQILSILQTYRANATFFVIGNKIAANPELIQAEVAAGNAVENHSWDHPHFTGIPSSAVSSQIVSTQEAILAAGAPAPTLFRFPYSSTNPSLNSQVQSLGLTIMGYSIDTNDWRGIPPNAIVSAVLDHATDGAVVVMHDGVRASVHTVEALPQILSGLQTRGFCTELATRVRPPDPGIKPLVGE